MGLFAEWQPEFAALDIATFPVTEKRPAVRNYLRAGLPASRQWADRFGSAEAFGIALKRSRLAVVDIDTTDERVLEDAVAIHGEPPFIVRTQSGGWHLYYRRTDEGRRVRPDPEKPIDVLGDGYVVAPPSRGSKGTYQIIRGTLDDLANLPPIQDCSKTRTYTNRTPLPAPSPALPATPVGARNNTLWRHLMAQAHFCDDFDALLDVARTASAAFHSPLPDDEVIGAAKSAWKYTTEGNNWFGIGRRVITTFAEVDDLMMRNPDAYLLLMRLRRHNQGSETFIVANAMAETMPGGRWRRERLTRRMRNSRGNGARPRRGASGSSGGARSASSTASWRWAAERPRDGPWRNSSTG